MHKSIIMLVPVLGALLIACKQSKTETILQKVPVINVIQKNVLVEHKYVCDIRAFQNVEIRSRITGFLEHIYIDEGQTVKKGQLLFSIADEEFKAEVSKAKAAVHNAIAEYKTAELESERIKTLVDKKIISAVEHEIAMAKLRGMKAKIEEAQSVLTSAEIKLSYTHIKAPFDGVIDRIQLKAGSLLNEGLLITTISDIREMYAYFNVSENEYLDYLQSKVKKNEFDTAKLILSDGKEYEYHGMVETVVSEFRENTGSIAFRVKFPNSKQILKHNATGTIKLTAQVENALLLPQKSVIEIQDKNYVFVIDDSGNVNMKNIVPYTRLNSFYVVKGGLHANDRIAYEGIQNLKEGMKIDAQAINTDTSLNTGIQ